MIWKKNVGVAMGFGKKAYFQQIVAEHYFGWDRCFRLEN